MPQQLYIQLGSSTAAGVYPLTLGNVPREIVDRLLRAVGLGAILYSNEAYADGLSVGEQQRLRLVRLIVNRPDRIFADEATSALCGEAEHMVTTLLRAELPEATSVIVAHRESQELMRFVRCCLAIGRRDKQ